MSDDADDPRAARRTRRGRGAGAAVFAGPALPAPYGAPAPGGDPCPAGYPEGRIPAVPGYAGAGTAPRTGTAECRVRRGPGPVTGPLLPAAARPSARSRLPAVTARAAAIRPEGPGATRAFGPGAEHAAPDPAAPLPVPPGRSPAYAHERAGQTAKSDGDARRPGPGRKPPVAAAPARRGRRPLRRPQAGISEARGAIATGPDRAPERRPNAPSPTPAPGLPHPLGTHRAAR
ncbi:hypothetical protein [Streptomyces erythrochromogenes]|uniref:hypothetical protein n=1 Tax=Streptomyces erythrochromogenes TaxID=285574 RepID=UPI00369711E2